MENNVGGNIARERHAQKMTQEQLAELSDLTINYLSKIERGVAKQLSVITLDKISAALGVTMDALMHSTDMKSSEKFGPNLRQLTKFLNNLEPDQSERLSKRLLEVIKLSQKTNE